MVSSGRHEEPVPGVVRIMTSGPIEVTASALEEQGALAEQLEERPWLVAVALLGMTGFFLALRRRDRR